MRCGNTCKKAGPPQPNSQISELGRMFPGDNAPWIPDVPVIAGQAGPPPAVTRGLKKSADPA